MSCSCVRPDLTAVVVFAFDSASKHYTGYIVLSVGLFGSLMVCKVIVATLCKQKINPLQFEMIVVSLIPVAITCVSSLTVKKELIVFFLLLSLLYSGVYAYQTVQRIATFLKIKILTV